MRLNEICAPRCKIVVRAPATIVFNAAHNPRQRSAGCVTLRKLQGNAVENSGLPIPIRWVGRRRRFFLYVAHDARDTRKSRSVNFVAVAQKRCMHFFDRSDEIGSEKCAKKPIKDYPLSWVRWTENRNIEAYLDLLAKGQIPIPTWGIGKYSIDEAPQA